jgi:putative sterol carrier protein
MPTQALLKALEKARQKMIRENGEPVIEKWNRQILYYFSDTDEYWLMKVVDGRPGSPVQQPDEVDDADIRLTMTNETFIGLMNGTVNGMQAFLGGRVKVKASMADMGKMQVFM